jgi:hypothetical protein
MSGAAKFTLIVIPLHGYRTTHQSAGTKNRSHHSLPKLLPAQLKSSRSASQKTYTALSAYLRFSISSSSSKFTDKIAGLSI